MILEDSGRPKETDKKKMIWSEKQFAGQIRDAVLNYSIPLIRVPDRIVLDGEWGRVIDILYKITFRDPERNEVGRYAKVNSDGQVVISQNIVLGNQDSVERYIDLEKRESFYGINPNANSDYMAFDMHTHGTTDDLLLQQMLDSYCMTVKIGVSRHQS